MAQAERTTTIGATPQPQQPAEIEGGWKALYSRNANSVIQPEKAGPDNLRAARQQVLHDTEHPSHLLLPVT